MARAFLIRWIANIAALFVAAWLLGDITYGDQWWTLFIAAAVFTIVNWLVKPILAVLSIPFIIVTFGLFYFLINILMLYVTDWLVPEFEIKSFWAAAVGAIIVSIINAIALWILPDARREDRR
jgi:putative membrane protein